MKRAIASCLSSNGPLGYKMDLRAFFHIFEVLELNISLPFMRRFTGGMTYHQAGMQQQCTDGHIRQ